MAYFKPVISVIAVLAALILWTGIGLSASAQTPPPKPKTEAPASAPVRQLPGKLLVRADADCTVRVNGEAVATLSSGEAQVVRVDLGEHLVEAVANGGQDRWESIVEVPDRKQTIVSVELQPIIEEREEKEQKVAERKRQEEAERRIRDKTGNLHNAIAQGSIEGVRAHLDAGADVNFANRIDRNGVTPLMLAAERGNTSIVDMLIGRGADVTAHDPSGKSVLHYAAQQGNTPILRELIDRGADYKAKDRYGRTPLDLAKKKGNSSIVRMLEDLIEGEIEDACRRLLLDYSSSGSSQVLSVRNSSDVDVRVSVVQPFVRVWRVGSTTYRKRHRAFERGVVEANSSKKFTFTQKDYRRASSSGGLLGAMTNVGFSARRDASISSCSGVSK